MAFLAACDVLMGLKITMIMQLCPAPSVALLQLSDWVWKPKLARLQVPAGTPAQLKPALMPLSGTTSELVTTMS